MKILLVVLAVQPGALNAPSVRTTPMQDLATCWAAAQNIVEANQLKVGPSLLKLGAGCAVVNQ